MKHNKHIHDEDYDINIKLMVPLLSMLVCTICLCATTWAWYTASVTSGVSTISSGIDASVSLSEISGSVAANGNNSYTASPGAKFTLNFNAGHASNGYYALIDITDEQTNKSTPETALQTLFGLFVNRIYAEEGPIRKAVYFNENTPGSIEITNSDSKTKIVTVNIVWADSDDTGHKLNTNLYPGYGDPRYGYEDNNINLTLQPQTSSVTVSYFDTENNLLPVSILASEETQNFGLRENTEEDKAIFTYETEESAFTVVAPDGYLLQKDENFNEDTDVPYRTYELKQGEENIINVICKKIVEEPAEADNSNDNNSEPAEEATTTYSYTINCVESDTNTVINTFGGTSEVGEITIDIPAIDGYKTVDDDGKVQINVSENVEANVFSIAYKKLYQYQINYVDENDNVLDTVSGSTVNDQIEVELKNFEYKELILIDSETSETLTRTFTIDKTQDCNVFEIKYQSIATEQTTNEVPMESQNEELASSN